MQSWYRTNFGDSGDRFLRYMARFMYVHLKRGGNLPLLARVLDDTTKSIIRARIVSLGGEAVRTFTLGDIVGVALHDRENRLGLRVVSDVDGTGKPVRGGYHWMAMGDSHLGRSTAGAETKAMAVAACITSLRDLERVRGIGVKLAGRSVSTAERTSEIRRALGGSSPTFVFAAKGFVPREDRKPGANVPYPTGGGTSPLDWRWGRLGSETRAAVDASVRGTIASELLARIDDVPDPVRRYGMEVRGTKAAFRAFCEHLRGQGIAALERAVGRKAR
jgi:hypothetical protein